jgi:pimeloyl-ACP methyl ester carboxylesterase
MLGSIVLAALCTCVSPQAATQSFVAETQRAAQEDLDKIAAKLSELNSSLAKLREAGVAADLLADVEVYAKAADWITRHGEFYSDKYAGWTIEGLERGLRRAAELDRKSPAWAGQTGRVSRGFVSRVDRSVQPYGLVIPAGYDPDSDRKWRLDVELHGRGSTLNEVSFLHAHDSTQPVPADQDFIQLDIFGRTNNAYRWAGETDVFEAIESVRRRYRIDERRVVLRGFSMGGAGSWHLGLHYPDRWCSVGPGAGFTDTRKYQKITTELPAWQADTLHIYDAEDYAANAFGVPVVAYGGENDPQLAASRRIRESLEKLGVSFDTDGLDATAREIPFLFLVGPKTEHQFHPESRKRAMAFHAEHAAAGTPYFRNSLQFVTYTLKYPGAYGYRIRRLDRHYDLAKIDVTPAPDGCVSVRTQNVALLEVSRGVATGLRLGDEVYNLDPAAEGRLPTVLFARHGDQWELLDYTRSLEELERTPWAKRPGLQGPIDDAFTESFLCVRGTGEPWSPALAAYANWSLDRFAREWDKYMRGRLRIKNDNEVTAEDIRDNHLILFGDPGSNRLLRDALDRLPVQWTRDTVRLGDQTYSTADHAPVWISPNPLNGRRYVVVNSGHTFHEADFKASNAQLYPRLGDFAALHFAATDSGYAETPVHAGILNERWAFVH